MRTQQVHSPKTISRSIYIAYLLLLSNMVFAQTAGFIRHYDFNSSRQIPHGIVENDRGYLFVHKAWDGQSFGFGIALTQTDWQGQVLFEKYFADADSLQNIYLHVGAPSLIKLKGGGYAYATSVLNDVTRENSIRLFRWDENLDTVFTRTYDAPAHDLGQQVVEAPNGDLAIGGMWNSPSIGLNGDCSLIRIDSTGNLKWMRTYRDGITPVQCWDLINTPWDNGFLMGGSKGDGQNTNGMIFKISVNGNLQWKKDIGIPNTFDGLSSVIYSTADNSIAVRNNFEDSLGYFRHRLIKLDTQGNVLWERIFWDHVSGSGASGYFREVAPGKGYILALPVLDSLAPPPNYGATTMVLLIRLDNDGNVLWQRRYGQYSELRKGYLSTPPVDVQPTQDGGFIVLARGNRDEDLAIGRGGTEALLIKVDSNGCIGNYCGLTDPQCFYKPYLNGTCDTTIVSVQDKTLQAAIRLYPNPAKDELQVVLPSGAIHITAHSLHDVLGRAVAAPAITNTNSSYSLSVKSLSPGIYFLRLHLNNGQTVVKKVWKE